MDQSSAPAVISVRPWQVAPALLLAVALCSDVSASTASPLSNADYDRAAQMLQVQDLIYNEGLEPHWIGDDDRLWYRSDDSDGHRFWLVEPLASSNNKRPAFDHARLAASLSSLRGEALEPLALPFEEIDLSVSGEVRFEIADGSGVVACRCLTTGDECALRKSPEESPEESPEPVRDDTGGAPKPPPGELLSPTGEQALILRDHDLYLVDKDSGAETRFTTDGEPWYDYASQPESSTSAVTVRRMGLRPPPSALFSPAVSKILTYRLDQRQVESLHLIQSTDLGDSARPVLHSYRFPLPGDEGVALSELVLIDVASGSLTPIAAKPAYTPYISLIDFQQVWWSEAGDQAYLLRRGRGSRHMALEEIDPATGAVRVIVEEESTHLLEPHLSIGSKPNVRVLASREVLWYSQRDGWGHLYLHDADGALVRQVTRGAAVVRDLLHVDEEERTILLTASGVDPDEDPYLRQLYRVSLDRTTDLEPSQSLTPERGDHTISMSPTGKTFVDVVSMIDQPTVSTVRSSATGRVLANLEEADFRRYLETGLRLPIPFEAKARDGKTSVYGTVLLPHSFSEDDPPASYPIIDGIYPGPQATRVAKSWQQGTGFLGMDLALAQLGFVVVSVDGFGTPLRSKAFHARSEGNLQEAGGLPDHLAVIRHLADRFPQIDLERVGIYGHSGGGFAAARAIFAYPDFYQVAVSSAGNHDQRGYLQLWGEHYHGDPATVGYEAQANASIAHQLKGKLLLAYGALDDNVHPALTLQVVDALTRANKDYDLIVMPRGNHGFSGDPYFQRRLWDYFVRHLARREPPAGYRIDTGVP